MTTRYIIDANVFIQGKNLHYNFAFCEGFWDWVHAGFKQGVIYSIGKVRAELVAGKKGDEGRTWAEQMPPGFFLDDVGDGKVMTEYGQVMNWANANTHYLPPALAKFADLNKADAFLLAYAKAHGHVIVTQEFSQPTKKREIPIPDAALGIGGIKPTMTIYDLLKAHAVPTFVFKP